MKIYLIPSIPGVQYAFIFSQSVTLNGYVYLNGSDSSLTDCKISLKAAGIYVKTLKFGEFALKSPSNL